MFLAGAKNLDAKKEWINELNVFPVPDGDTGTNMSMTVMSAAREVRQTFVEQGSDTIPVLAKAFTECIDGMPENMGAAWEAQAGHYFIR